MALGDPVYQDMQTFQALPPHIPRDIEHFFTTYKFLEQQPVQSFGWADVEAAHQAVRHAHAAYGQPSAARETPAGT